MGVERERAGVANYSIKKNTKQIENNFAPQKIVMRSAHAKSHR